MRDGDATAAKGAAARDWADHSTWSSRPPEPCPAQPPDPARGCATPGASLLETTATGREDSPQALCPRWVVGSHPMSTPTLSLTGGPRPHAGVPCRGAPRRGLLGGHRDSVAPESQVGQTRMELVALGVHAPGALAKGLC